MLYVLYAQVRGSAGETWAGRLQSPGLLWLLISLPDCRSHCYVVLSWFAGGSYPVPLPFNCSPLGAGVGVGSVCVSSLQEKSSMRKLWPMVSLRYKHMGTVPGKYARV